MIAELLQDPDTIIIYKNTNSSKTIGEIKARLNNDKYIEFKAFFAFYYNSGERASEDLRNIIEKNLVRVVK